MDREDFFPVAVMVFILIVVAVGEVITVTNSHDDFKTSVYLDENESDILHYRIESSNAHTYQVVSLKDTLDPLVDVSIYYDPNYHSVMGDGKSSIGSRSLDQEYYVEQLSPTLKVRGISNVKIVDANELLDLMLQNGKGHSVIVLSGALPDTVYNGESDSTVLRWLDEGGRLYWAGNVIGKYVAHMDSVDEVKDEFGNNKGTPLFLGSNCIDEGLYTAFDEVDDEDSFRDRLCLRNNATTYSLNKGLIHPDIEYKMLGYTDGERASITLVSYGEGMICVMGGEYSYHQRVDLCEVVASNIGPKTIVLDHVSGSVFGVSEGTIARADGVFFLLGDFYPVYADYKVVEDVL